MSPPLFLAARRLSRVEVVGIRLDLDAEEFIVTGTNRSQVVVPLADVLADLAGRPASRQEQQKVVEDLDVNARFWARADGTPPPEGGWRDDEKPGRR